MAPAIQTGPAGDRAGASARSWRYVTPFAVFLILLGLAGAAGAGPQVAYPARVVAAALVFGWASRNVVNFKPSWPWASVLAGVAVFGIWIAPDLLWRGYRDLWLFRNPLTGAAHSTIPEALHGDAAFLAIRVAGSVLLVPVIEELFWRAWLMRWLISPHFAGVPLGAYAPRAFWLTAVLFALEHGPYWDVGLAAGVAYNWWMIRTRNLADCMLAHGVTNACLAGYVLVAGAWQYWL